MSQRTFASVPQANRPVPLPSSFLRRGPNPGDHFIVQFGLGLYRTVTDQVTQQERHIFRQLTRPEDRLPAFLGDIRTLADVTRFVRNHFTVTLAQQGLQPNQISLCAAFRDPIEQTHPRSARSDDEWQPIVNVIAGGYRNGPNVVLACFPAGLWSGGPEITFQDHYDPQLAQRLHTVSIPAYRHYRLIFQRLQARVDQARTQAVQSAPRGTSLSVQTGPGLTPPSPSIQQNRQNPTRRPPHPRLRNRPSALSPSRQVKPPPTDNKNTNTKLGSVKGPKGRSLAPSVDRPRQKEDYSKATLFPRTATQGKKAVSDKCLTCIRNNRKCSGTRMTFQQNVRGPMRGSWKCDQCHPRRRCLWRPALDRVYTYDEEFARTGGTRVEKNSRAGRKRRAEEKLRAQQQQGGKVSGRNDDEESEESESEDEDDDQDEDEE